MAVALTGHPLGLWAVALAIGAAALVFWLALPAERRLMRPVWVLLVLALAAHGAAVALGPEAMLARILSGGATVALGLAVIQVAVAGLFRGLLPRVGVNAPRIVGDLTVTALALGWGLVWLRLSGVDTAQLFTTSALITAVLAFAMQDTLGNVLGGVALQLDSSLHVGDWVRVDGVTGRVADVRWRFTAIETTSGERFIVPNSWLMKNRFAVIRRRDDGQPEWRRTLVFNVSGEADAAQVIHALEHALTDAEIPGVLRAPPPSAVLMEVGAGYNRYQLRYWLADPALDDPTDSAARVHALAALARAGLRLGVPQEERLNITEDDSWRAAAQQREFDRRLEAIRRTALFAELADDEQRELARHLVHAPFAAGDVITRQGAVAHWLYLVNQGEAQVLVDGPRGRVTVATLRDGAFFGEMGMLTGEPRQATVVAITAVDCYRLDKQGFAQIIQARPEVAREMSALVEKRNAELNATLVRPGEDAAPAGDLLARIRHFFSISG